MYSDGTELVFYQRSIYHKLQDKPIGMKVRNFSVLTSLTTAILLAMCIMSSCGNNSSSKGGDYKVVIPLTEFENGLKGYLVDFDSGNTIDSTVVENSSAIFTGTIDQPYLVRVIVDGDRLGQLILEPGEILFGRTVRTATGTPLNDRLNQIGQKESEIVMAMRNLSESDPLYMEKAQALQAHYDSLNQSTLNDNADNLIGYLAFIDQAYEWPLDTLNLMLERYPQFANSRRITHLKRSLELQAQTSPGETYKDFAVEYDGKIQKLSDYVKDDKFTLVDFWAGWCRPCLQEIKYIKSLYNSFGPGGTDQLNVVGVGVWEEPQNTLKAISENQIPWPNIINAQSIPTDIYGIPSIPCIILIGPDQKILLRNLQDTELVNEVTRILQEAKQNN